MATELALVTGASSGIGRAFAHRLAADGVDLVVVGRDRARLEALAAEFPNVSIRPLVADLATDAGVRAVAEACAAEPLTMLVNNAGVAHYMPFAKLPTDKAAEIVHVKSVAPIMLCQAAVPGMVARGKGAIINVASMLSFSGSAPRERLPLPRAVYVATGAHLVAFSQCLHEELKASSVQVQVLCPGIVATEFHVRQGMDTSAVPRMSAEDVVTASLRGLALGEIVCTPGLEHPELLDSVREAQMAVFTAQTTKLATRYQEK